MNHQLTKEAGMWHCQTCCRQWRGKPRGECVGVPVTATIGTDRLVAKDAHRLNRAIAKDARPLAYFVAEYEQYKYDRSRYIYALGDTTIVDPNLPPAMLWDDAEARGYVAVTTLFRNRRQPKRGTDPIACALSFKGDWIDFYRAEDTEPGDRLQYVTKGTLKTDYYFSDGWIKKLGDPDFYAKNPHYSKGSPMKLYRVGRVEDFLEAHADEFAAWLVKRQAMQENGYRLQRYVEENRDLIAATRRVRRQAETLVYRDSRIPTSLKLDKNSLEAHKKQLALCLQCAWGAAWEGGFLCSIHPIEYVEGVPDRFLCPDFEKR